MAQTIAGAKAQKARYHVERGERCPGEIFDLSNMDSAPNSPHFIVADILNDGARRVSCKVEIDGRTAVVFEYPDESIVAFSDNGAEAIRCWVVRGEWNLEKARIALDEDPRNHECNFVYDPGDPSVGIWPGYICLHSPLCYPTEEQVRELDEKAMHIDQVLREFQG